MRPSDRQWRMLQSGNRRLGGSAAGGVSLFCIRSAERIGVRAWASCRTLRRRLCFSCLATVYPPLEALQKEGESGRRRLNEYTRYATVVVCLLQSFFLLRSMSRRWLWAGGRFCRSTTAFSWLVFGTIVMTAGTVFLMWIGEQIDAYGIGNGISLLIMAGILARMPDNCDESGLRELRRAAFRLVQNSGLNSCW